MRQNIILASLQHQSCKKWHWDLPVGVTVFYFLPMGLHSQLQQIMDTFVLFLLQENLKENLLRKRALRNYHLSPIVL